MAQDRAPDAAARGATPVRALEDVEYALERELNDFHPGQEQTVRCIVDLIRNLIRSELAAALARRKEQG